MKRPTELTPTEQSPKKPIHFGMIVLSCCCLFLAPLVSFAQSGATGYPNEAAVASYSHALAPSFQDQAIAQTQPNALRQAMSPFREAPALWAHVTDFSPDSAQTAGQTTTKPPASNTPSLQGLGFPPNEIQGNAKEQELLNRRSHMLQIHQKLGLIAAIPMVAAIFSGPGAKGHHGLPGSPTGRDVHMGLGIVTTGLYWASAYYAIRAPRIPDEKSYGLIRLHKAMAWIHGPGMILTPILGAIAFSQLSRGERVHGIAKYHAWAAYTTTAAYGVAILSVVLK